MEFKNVFLFRDSSYLIHVERVHNFPCSEPQLRAVPVRDLLEIGPSPDEMFYPPSTVLLRCAEAGCCPKSNQICAPTEVKNISLVFTVKHLIDRTRDRHHEIIHVLNHVKCNCVEEKFDTEN